MGEMVAAAASLVAITFLVTFLNCTILSTMRENTLHQSAPPNAFQWGMGWDCTCEVWRGYLHL